MACDLRIGGASARFGTGFAGVGYSGDFGGSWSLTRLVGTAKARELYFLGDIIDAAAAASLGLVNRVVADEAAAARDRRPRPRIADGPHRARARGTGGLRTHRWRGLCAKIALSQSRRRIFGQASTSARNPFWNGDLPISDNCIRHRRAERKRDRLCRNASKTRFDGRERKHRGTQ
jgi:enoyl-CoA hydratase/carnithine racemase